MLQEFIDGILRCKGPARAIDQAGRESPYFPSTQRHMHAIPLPASCSVAQVALHADIRQLDHKLAVAVQL